ncbi:MAG: diguanylate cyclase [Pseudomonas sp.]|nr:diguanylate cyclase [Pseudomonas sp.]
MHTSHTPRYRIQTRLGLAWFVFLFLLFVYWLRLDFAHQSQLAEAQERAELRASQTAHALSTQVNTQLMGIHFMLEHLAEHWVDHDETVFRKLIDLSQDGIFKGSLDVISVTDTEGNVVFNSNTQQGQFLDNISMADRSYFQQLTHPDTEGFLISAPALNMMTQRWTVQFSHRMLDNGQFAGIITASVPVEHLAEAFKQVFPAKEDVVLLTLNDGQYLARTHALKASLTTKVPADRDFIQNPEQISGNYSVVAPIDGVERIYAWHRIHGFPVVLSLGLGKDQVLGPVSRSIQESRQQNFIGTILLLLAALWITRLVFNQAKQNRSILQAKERLTTLLNQLPSGALLEDENSVIVAANAKLCALLNIDLKPNSLVGLHHDQFLTMLQEEQASWLPLASITLEQGQFTEEIYSSSGHILKVDWVPIQRDHRYLGHVWFIQDISSRKQKEQALQTLATTDPLTGLHNRRSFLDTLQQQLELSQVDLPGALLMIDIDHFKKVNDTYGHPVGDRVIQNVTQAIHDTVRKDDFSGRLGGEEFAVLLPQVTLQQALQVAEHIRQNVETTITPLETETVRVTVSIGVTSMYGKDKNSIQIAADQALYTAKNSGRNRVCHNA